MGQNQTFRSKQRGFMLIQVLVATGLLAMLGLAFAGLLRDMWRENQKLQTKSNEMTLGQSLIRQISSEDVCNQSLVNRTAFLPGAVRPMQIKLNVTDPVAVAIAAGRDFNNWNLRVNSFNFTNSTTAVSSFGGRTVYVGDLELEAESLNGAKMHYKNKSLGKMFLVVRDSDRYIESCYTAESSDGMAKNVCSTLGGIFNDATKICNMDNIKNQWKTEIASEILKGIGSCTSGQVMLGFNADGSLQCGTGTNTAAKPNICFATAEVRTGRLKQTCCADGGGSCSMTGTKIVTERSGGRGDTIDYTVPLFTCLCGS